MEEAERQLARERVLRKGLEDSQESRAKGIESSWQAVLGEKQDNWEAKERSLEEKLETQERLFNEAKASYEVSQRLGHHTEGEDDTYRVSASAAELEIVSSDLERTSNRLAEVEARNEQLRIELAQALSSSPRKAQTEDDPVFTRLRSENGSLLRKLDAAKFEKDSESRKWESRIRLLERDSQTLQRDREELRDRLHNWRDYPDIKRELEVFKVQLLGKRQKSNNCTADRNNRQSSSLQVMMMTRHIPHPPLRMNGQVTNEARARLMVLSVPTRRRHLNSFFLPKTRS